MALKTLCSGEYGRGSGGRVAQGATNALVGLAWGRAAPGANCVVASVTLFPGFRYAVSADSVTRWTALNPKTVNVVASRARAIAHGVIRRQGYLLDRIRDNRRKRSNPGQPPIEPITSLTIAGIDFDLDLLIPPRYDLYTCVRENLESRVTHHDRSDCRFEPKDR